MKNKLSTKHYVLVLYDSSRFFLDDDEYKIVVNGIEAGGKGIFFKDGWIATSAIMKIITGTDYQESEKIKRGDYKCDNCDRWIQKNKICGYCG